MARPRRCHERTASSRQEGGSAGDEARPGGRQGRALEQIDAQALHRPRDHLIGIEAFAEAGE